MSINMLDSLTADTLYSEIIMQKDVIPQALLLVEGPEDSRTLFAHVSEDACQIIVCGGRENVLGAMLLVSRNRVPGVGALVDADHSRGQAEPRLSISGVIATDLNDLDSEILHIPGLVERVGYSHVDSWRLSSLLIDSGVADIRELMNRIVAPITGLRCMCERHGVPISTSRFPIVAVYRKGEASLDVEKVKVIAKGKLPEEYSEEFSALIEQWISDAATNGNELRPFHNGHHLFHALHALLRCECGYEPKVDNIENSVRAAVSWSDLWGIGCIRKISEYFESMGYWIWRYPQGTAA